MKNIISQFFSSHYRFIFFIFFIFFVQSSYSQLSDFSLAVTPTNETCENNGTLSLSTSGTTAGATVLYSIYLLPNTTTAVGVTAASLYSGLSSGTYRVVATQSLGSESNFKQQDVVILNQVVQLSYSMVGENHICDNKITVNVNQGTAVSYEIISGPVLKPLQASNVFTGLTPGVYLIRVFDNCGDGIVQTFTLVNSASDTLQITVVNTIVNADCNVALVTQGLNNAGTGDFIYPITIHYEFIPPTGPVVILDQVLASGEDDLITVSQELPLFPGQTLSYSLTVTDGCGKVYQTIGNMPFPVSDPYIASELTGCNTVKYTVKNAAAASITVAPPAYLHPLPHILVESSEENSYLLENLPNGSYTFSLIDFCGEEHIKQIVVDTPEPAVPTGSVLNGCEPGFGSVNINSFHDLVSVKIMQAPAAAGFTLPYDVSFNLDTQSYNFWMNSLPQGTYVFKTLDICNFENTLTYTVDSYQQTATVNVMENCGSFDIKVVPSQNVPNPMSYWLQKFDAVNNTWGHPYTGNVYIDNAVPNNTNSIGLNPNVVNYNITGYGHFRVIGRYNIFGNAATSKNCLVVVEEFDFIAKPKINNVVSVSCQDGTYDVIVDASGVAPFTYKILTKNGGPFLIENQDSSLFLGVEAAVYGFEVEDHCGNILTADYEIGNSDGFPIDVDNLCSGQNVSLSVLSFPFLSYEWWKGNDVTNILGTSNILNFTTFDPVANSGTYHVRVYYANNPASCINFISDIDVFLNTDLPEAGVASNPTYCGSPGQIDLFSLLSNYDTGGLWQEITNSGMLSGNNWDASALQSGSYQFKYKVSDDCNNSDEVTLNVTIKSVPGIPIISADPVICSNEPLHLFASEIQSGTYQWSGPNGFTSTLQNPVIENPTSANDGVYSLKIVLNGCESEITSTTLKVNDFPEFTIAGGCENNEDNYVLRAYPLGNSFEDEVIYSWSGPEGFSANQNPISVTNYPVGIYTLTVTNSLGCSSFQDFDVKSTVCRIPKGISPNNDGDNDSFDLSGFDIVNLKIYSRYGRLVYEKENYKSDWYGQDFKDRELPDATYFYHVLLRTGEERVGWVYKTH